MRTCNGSVGVVPQLTSDDLLAAVPALASLAQIEVSTLCLQPSASLDIAFLLSVLDWAVDAVEAGAHGVVITLGTDTLEETAYLLDLLWPLQAPLVVTGAMRAASDPGADGPANLLAAARVALAPQSRDRGVLVVLNDEIHSAHRVRKVASLALSAFSSGYAGLAGVIIEGEVRFWRGARPRRVIPRTARGLPRVALLEACLDADVDLLASVGSLGYDGLVIAGFGAGHVSERWRDALIPLVARLPVVVATRTGDGPTAYATYGFIGGEIDLQAQGVQMAGGLCPRKCRLLLTMLLAADLPTEIGPWLPD